MSQDEPPVVWLDWDVVPDGVGLVVIRWAPGALYLHQYGGTACLQGEVQGYAVPVDLAPAQRELDDFFVRELGGTGLGSPRQHPGRTVRFLRTVVVRVWYPATGQDGPAPLRLDDERVSEADEGWVPVLTADGPGVLLWPSSD